MLAVRARPMSNTQPMSKTHESKRDDLLAAVFVVVARRPTLGQSQRRAPRWRGRRSRSAFSSCQSAAAATRRRRKSWPCARRFDSSLVSVMRHRQSTSTRQKKQQTRVKVFICERKQSILNALEPRAKCRQSFRQFFEYYRQPKFSNFLRN